MRRSDVGWMQTAAARRNALGDTCCMRLLDATRARARATSHSYQSAALAAVSTRARARVRPENVRISAQAPASTDLRALSLFVRHNATRASTQNL